MKYGFPGNVSGDKKTFKKPLTKPASVCIIILVADSEATRQEENASVLELVDRPA